MKKILVIEDEKSVREIICEILLNEGFEPIPAVDGMQAVALLEQFIPDLVISDIMMPKMDGYQVLEHFQNLPSMATIPFIFLSAKADNPDIRNGMLLGANDYITKPFRAKELIQTINTQLKKKEKSDKVFEDICLDISAYIPHELRTPLIPIIGFTEIIQEGLDDLSKSEISDLLNKIKYSSHRLHDTIEKFIRYTEIQVRIADKKSSSDNNNEVTNLSGIIISTECKKIMNALERAGDLEVDITEAELSVYEHDLVFIIRELITNAIKFSSPGTRIEVKTWINEGSYYLEVTDYGRGMTTEQIANIKPFIQHERKKYQQQGNGLGLFIVKKLMEYYSGTLELISEVNKFTTCRVSFPLSFKLPAQGNNFSHL
jgi:signal transduction histidine kinase